MILSLRQRHGTSDPMPARRVGAPLIAALALAVLAVGCAENGDGQPTGRIVMYDDSGVILDPAAGGKAQPFAIDDAFEVAFTPDASRVAFSSERGIALMTVRDGRATLIPNQPPQDRFLSGDISWAPDGRSLAFANDETIFTISIDGSDLRDVTRGSQPSWAPDGEHIVFVSDWDVNTGVGDIAVVRVDGTGRRVLGRGDSPAVSPTGDTIAYSTSDGVFVQPLDGGARRLVVRDGFGPVWSPDGSFLAFTRHTSCGHAACSGRVFVMPVQGGEPRAIGPTMFDPGGPEDWIR